MIATHKTTRAAIEAGANRKPERIAQNSLFGEPIKERREQMKKDILSYNFDDVMATRKLEEWLRSQ